jgi:2-haloacid dehalogenase
VSDRWATFDCYGTLIDWNGGIAGELARLFGAEEAPRLLDRYHELEPQVQSEDPELTYRRVLTLTLGQIADSEGLPLADGEHDALARSLPSWTPFPEVPGALEEARARGWRLAILSNTDRDLIESSMERIGVPFELAIVASEIGSYKPARGHWDAFAERTASDQGVHVHVAASLNHDIAPAGDLGIPAIWINRLGEESDLPRAAELSDLRGLADALDRAELG